MNSRINGSEPLMNLDDSLAYQFGFMRLVSIRIRSSLSTGQRAQMPRQGTYKTDLLTYLEMYLLIKSKLDTQIDCFLTNS